MSDDGQQGEPSAAGSPQFSRLYAPNAGFRIELPQLASARSAITELHTALGTLKASLQQFGSSTFLASAVNRQLTSITTAAQNTRSALLGVSMAMGGIGAASPGGGGPAYGTGTAGSWSSTATQSAASAISAASGGGGGRAGGATGLGGLLGSGEWEGKDSSYIGKQLAMVPFRYLRDRINTNRDFAIQASNELSMVSRQQNTDVSTILRSIGQFPGSIYGGPAELTSLFATLPRYGAQYNFGGNPGAPWAGQQESGGFPAGQGVRAAGMLRGIREAQMLNPGANVMDIAGAIGGFAANTPAQQQSAYLTGGAMSMIASGGRQKSLSEWAEGVLKWVEGLRPGDKRGKAFNYGELLAQQFPGSNIDAWLTVNGVNQQMKDYWWTYVLGRASKNIPALPEGIGPREQSLSWQRLKATTELTRTEFSLASRMSGAYANREQANKWFNELFGQMQENIIPALVGTGGLGGFIQYMPDPIQDLLFGFMEKFAGMRTPQTGDVSEGPYGDIGDQGGYGTVGGTGTAGLHPDMKRKLGAMMQANPRLSVTSGLLAYNAMQKRLKSRGVGRVSGRPSAHTRGMAADLGPRSEYGWISRNAKKFGLKSGVGEGEPWHVGMGDIGELPDIGPSGFFNVLGELLKGWASPENMGIASGGLIGLLMSPFATIAGNPQTPTTTSYDPTVYNQMVEGSKKGLTIGSTQMLGPLFELFAASAAGGATGGGFDTPSGGEFPTQPISGSTLGAFFQSVLTGIGAPTSQANLNKLGVVSVMEGYRAGGYNPFNSNSAAPGSVIYGAPGSATYRAKIQNYPDPETGIAKTIELLNSPNRHKPEMKANLVGGGSYSDWIDATQAFYQTWPDSGWERFDRLTEAQGAAQLAKPLGDLEYESMTTGSAVRRSSSVNFHNTFNIQGDAGGGGGGIDIRRTVTLIADQLEDEMKRRTARTN